MKGLFQISFQCQPNIHRTVWHFDSRIYYFAFDNNRTAAISNGKPNLATIHSLTQSEVMDRQQKADGITRYVTESNN